MNSILDVKEERRKRSRPVVYDKPEQSMLSTWQFVIAMAAVFLFITLVINFFSAHK